MLRALPIVLLAGLGGCTYNPHRDFSDDYGDSVRANIARQVVNPIPLRSSRPPGNDGVRMNSAYVRYETNKVYPPTPVQSLQTGPASSGGGGPSPPPGAGGSGSGASP